MPQRAITFESGDVRLEGALILPDGEGPFPAAVVCHPHPQYGGSMHNNVVSAVASSVVQRGVAAVLFNFRGAGGSEGVAGNRDEALVDVVSALEHAASFDELDAARIGLAGYSFGAGSAAAVVSDAVPALALISLPLTMAEDARGTLTAYAGPLLLISGDEDEGSNEAGLRAFAESTAGKATVEIVAGADHFWWGDEQSISDAVGPFFAEALRS